MNDTCDIIHTPFSNEKIKYFDIDYVQIVNVNDSTIGFPRCDVNIGRKWKDSYGVHPLAGLDGQFGNPSVMDKDGTRV